MMFDCDECKRDKSDSKLCLSPPWVRVAKSIDALFAGDKDVIVSYDEDAVGVKLLVTGQRKAEALSAILPDEYEFGNQSMTLTVVPSNETGPSLSETLLYAFEGNDALSDVIEKDVPLMGSFTYALFKPDVVQYFADDLSDANGMRTLTYAQAASEVLDCEAFICTDLVRRDESAS